MGDFNYRYIKWVTLEAIAEEAEFLDMVPDCFLTQHVTEPTRDSNTVLDLVSSTEPELVEDVEMGSLTAISDRYTIFSI